MLCDQSTQAKKASLIKNLTSESIRFAQSSYLSDMLEVLVPFPQQYFKMFGLNTRAFSGGKYGEGSDELAYIVYSQYEEVLKTARGLGISESARELATDSEAQDSLGDIAYKTLHEIITILLEVEHILDQLQIGVAAVLRLFKELARRKTLNLSPNMADNIRG